MSVSPGWFTGRAVVPAILAASVLGLTAAYAIKAPCLDREWDGVQFRRLCYNDAQPLYFSRGLSDGRFPYIHSTVASREARQDLEYPAGTGLYLGAIASLTSTPNGFFNLNAAGLAAMGLAAAAALAAMARVPRRVLLFSVGPAVVLYAFHNWDLLAVGLTSLAMFAYARRRDAWTGLLLGLGAATKLYPALLLPAFALGAGRRSGAVPWTMAVSFLASVAALNLPLMILNFAGWAYPWEFQAARPANYETVWYMVYRHAPGAWFREPGFLNTVSASSFAVGALALIAFAMRRDRLRPFALGFGIVTVFLLTAKVFSPQYALWLLPFFALLQLPWWSYVAWAVTDAAVWFATASFFLVVQLHDLNREPEWRAIADGRLDVLEIAVWARYAVLVVLLILSTRVEELVRAPEVETAGR